VSIVMTDPFTDPDEDIPQDWRGACIVLGHELGHAVFPNSPLGEDEVDGDDGTPPPGGGQNITANENPIREYFGLPPRRHYHGWPIGQSK
jgi:hypothetical protein